jgi:hypothetical protein
MLGNWGPARRIISLVVSSKGSLSPALSPAKKIIPKTVFLSSTPTKILSGNPEAPSYAGWIPERGIVVSFSIIFVGGMVHTGFEPRDCAHHSLLRTICDGVCLVYIYPLVLFPIEKRM